MTTPEAAASPRSPLSVVMDVIVAPKSAFEEIDARPRWLIAFLVVCVLGIISSLLTIPVAEHVSLATFNNKIAHDPSTATLPASQLAQVKYWTLVIPKFVWLIYPLIAAVFIAVAAGLLLVGDKIGKGQGTFARYFALAANIGIINLGIGYLLRGILCALHSPDAFNTQSDVVGLIPSLASIVPGAGPQLTVFLQGFNPFTIWSFVLLAMGMRTIGKVGPGIAYGTAAVVGFGNLLFAIAHAQ